MDYRKKETKYFPKVKIVSFIYKVLTCLVQQDQRLPFETFNYVCSYYGTGKDTSDSLSRSEIASR